MGATTLSYEIQMRIVDYTVTAEDALSHYPAVGVSNLTKAEAEMKVRVLNSMAIAGGWGVDFECVAN